MSPAAATLQWVEKFVIRYALCPFAARPFSAGKVTAETCGAEGEEACFFWALSQVQGLLEEQSEVETTLLVFPDQFPEFLSFMDFVYAIEDALTDTGANEMIQLAHFHPQYQFADAESDDPSNRTNRSPYPVLQLLRVASVAAAVAAYPEVEDIPQRNIDLMHKLFPA